MQDGPVYGDDGLLAGPPKVVNLARCAHVLLGYLESPKGIMAVVRMDRPALAEFTERLFSVYLSSTPDLGDGYVACTVQRTPFLKAATLAKQFKWIWYELAGAPPAAPRGSALLHKQLERDARVGLPEEVVARAETILASLVEPWHVHITELKQSLAKMYQNTAAEDLKKLVSPTGDVGKYTFKGFNDAFMELCVRECVAF